MWITLWITFLLVWGQIGIFSNYINASQNRQIMQKELRQLKEEKLRRLAQKDVSLFNSLCFKDKQGQAWQTTDFQREWHSLLDKYPRLVIFAPIEHGKTEQIVRSGVLRDFGRDRDQSIAIISNTFGQAQKSLGEIAEDIEINENYHSIYPEVRRETRDGKFQKWTDSALIIERDITSKDYSLQSVGLHGNILGARLDKVILDDCNDFENTFTSIQREKAVKWIVSTVLGRLMEKGKCVCIQTTWHEDDIGHILAEKHRFHKVVYKAIKDDGTPLWAEKWSIGRIEEKRKELGEIEFARQLMNLPLSDAMRIFKRAWFEECLELGGEYSLVDSYVKNDLRLITGVDLATRKGEEHDLTVFFTIGVNTEWKKRVLNIMAKRMEFPEIIRTFKVIHNNFPNTLFVVENNSAQVYISQHLKDISNIKVKGFLTGKNKADPLIGVRSMGVDFENGKWLIPRGDETMKWIQEFLSWSPQSHAGDRLMASWFADSETGKPTGDIINVGGISDERGIKEPVSVIADSEEKEEHLWH